MKTPSIQRALCALCLAVAQLFCAPLSSSIISGQETPSSRAQRGVERYIKKYERVDLDGQSAAERIRNTHRLQINGETKTFDLELEPHDIRGARYRAVDVSANGVERQVEMGDAVRTFKGRVRDTGQEARFTVDGERIEGVIIGGDENYFVEPLRKFEPSAKQSDYILYKGSDVVKGGADECSATLAERINNGAAILDAHPASDGGVAVNEATATGQQTYKEVEIATEADNEYVVALGGAAAANGEIISILNQIEGIYKNELGLSFKIVYQGTWTDANDPYTQADSSKLLYEFRNYWISNRTNIARDIAHLWTGKDVYSTDMQGNQNFNNVGLAFNNVTCRVPEYAYGLSERRLDAGSKVRVTAHEIGHNFGATHSEGVAGCDNTIMAASGGPATQSTFCQNSRDEIKTYLSANSSCLTAVTIGTTNPIDDAATFVRQQYLDFLGREPDAPGLGFWTGEITMCGTDAACIDRKRVNTSGAFFLSTEFQSTGYFIYRFYTGALNRAPQFAEFSAEQQQIARGIVVNNQLSDQAIENNKNVYVAQFAARADFRAIYDGLSNQDFVNELFRRTGVNVSDADKKQLADGLNGGTETRVSVLRKILDGTRTVNNGVAQFTTSYGKAFYDQQFNAAFVLMQYFGYLRRDKDQGGYQFWLDKPNFYGNFTDAEMVKAFILSDEYRRRFGAP